MRKLNEGQIKEIIKGARTGLSLNQLSKKFGLSKTTIYYHAKEFCRKMGKFDEKLLSEWERGYLIGFFVGDGCWIFRPKYHSYITKFTLNARTEKVLASFLTTILTKAGIKPWTAIKNNKLDVKASSKNLQNFLMEYVRYEPEGYKLRKRLLLDKIFKRREEFAFGILAGLVDSDGHVGYGGYKRHSLSVIITTASEVLSILLVQLVKELGMEATVTFQRSNSSFSPSRRFYVRILTHSATINVNRIKSLKLFNAVAKDKRCGPIAQR